MTKKHYVAFAKTMKEDLESSKRFDAAEQKRTYDAVNYAANAFADLAVRFNGLFDRQRFLDACGL